MPQKEERIPEDLVFVCSLNNTTPAGNNMTFTCLLFASYFNLRVKGLLGLLGIRVWLMKAYCIRTLQPYNPTAGSLYVIMSPICILFQFESERPLGLVGI